MGTSNDQENWAKFNPEQNFCVSFGGDARRIVVAAHKLTFTHNPITRWMANFELIIFCRSCLMINLNCLMMGYIVHGWGSSSYQVIIPQSVRWRGGVVRPDTARRGVLLFVYIGSSYLFIQGQQNVDYCCSKTESFMSSRVIMISRLVAHIFVVTQVGRVGELFVFRRFIQRMSKFQVTQPGY